MRAFVISAGKGISNKGLFKKWIKYPVDSVMQQSITNTGFVNLPRLRVTDGKSIITAVLIGAAFKLIAERGDIIHQIPRELAHILFVSFP